VIKKNPGLSITDISTKINKPLPKVSVFVASFRENGWILEKKAGPTKYIYLTDAGKIALKQLKSLTGAKAGMIGKALRYI